MVAWPSRPWRWTWPFAKRWAWHSSGPMHTIPGPARTDGPSALQVLHPVDEGRAVQADQGVAPRPRVQLWPTVVDRACASVSTERASRMPRGNVRSLRVDTALRHGGPPGHSRLLNVHRAANGVYDVKAPNEMLYGIQA